MPEPIPPPIPFYKQGAFIITLLLIPLVYMAVWIVLTSTSQTFGPDGKVTATQLAYSSDVRTLVIGACVVTLLGVIAGFWMAGSHNATPKPDPTADSEVKPNTILGVKQ